MAVEPSVQDQVLQAFLERIGETVSPALLRRLSGLLAQKDSISGRDLLKIIEESVSTDAED